jgi:hypothetical protein
VRQAATWLTEAEHAAINRVADARRCSVSKLLREALIREFGLGEVKQYDHRKLQDVQEACAEGAASRVTDYTLAGVLAEIDAT